MTETHLKGPKGGQGGAQGLTGPNPVGHMGLEAMPPGSLKDPSGINKATLAPALAILWLFPAACFNAL